MTIIVPMKLVVLAAGEGARMRPLTLNMPKPLLSFGGKTLLDHLFEVLPREITEAVITVGYLGNKIRKYCGDEFHGRKIAYIDGSMDGNAAGFLKAKSLFSPKERLAVSYGDEIITKKEMEDCLAHEYSWLCYKMENPKNVGVARVDSKNKILEVLEKPGVPPSNLVANGFMVGNADLFYYTPDKNKNGEYYFSSLMNTFCKKNDVVAVVGEEDHAHISTPEDLKRLDEWCRKNSKFNQKK